MTIHMPYEEIFNKQCDFLVSYQLNPDRAIQNVNPTQGMRCDFVFNRGESLHRIYPEILDKDGQVILDKGQRIDDRGMATMWVISTSEAYLQQLKNRLYVGQNAFWVVGSSVLAEVVVIDIFCV